MEKLIVIEGEEKYKFNDLKSLVEQFINKNFYNMTKQEQDSELEKKAIANTYFDKILITKDEKKLDDTTFLISDEITYLISMLKFNKIYLLERTDSNILGRYINKENIEDNYIILNMFSDQIMEGYLKNKI